LVEQLDTSSRNEEERESEMHKWLGIKRFSDWSGDCNPISASDEPAAGT
jgi:hypothetical protein